MLLEWDDPADDSIVGYQIWRRYHRDGHEDAERPPVDDELQLHVAHTGNAENHFHDSDFVEHETVYGYAVSALGSEGVLSEEVTVTTPDAPGEAPEEIEGVSLEVVEGDVRITWSSLNDDTITDFHISRTSEDHPDGGNWIHLTNAHHATTEFLDFHGLETGKTYVYTIAAQNEHGVGPHSDAARITVTGKASLDETPTPSGDAPSAPAGVRAEAVHDVGGHKVVITWDTHASDEGVTDWIITRWDPRLRRQPRPHPHRRPRPHARQTRRARRRALHHLHLHRPRRQPARPRPLLPTRHRNHRLAAARTPTTRTHAESGSKATEPIPLLETIRQSILSSLAQQGQGRFSRVDCRESAYRAALGRPRQYRSGAQRCWSRR